MKVVMLGHSSWRPEDDTGQKVSLHWYKSCAGAQSWAISYLTPHAPPPLQICANFAKNPVGGPPPLLEKVQKVLKGGPLLFFAHI